MKVKVPSVLRFHKKSEKETTASKLDGTGPQSKSVTPDADTHIRKELVCPRSTAGCSGLYSYKSEGSNNKATSNYTTAKNNKVASECPKYGGDVPSMTDESTDSPIEPASPSDNDTATENEDNVEESERFAQRRIDYEDAVSIIGGEAIVEGSASLVSDEDKATFSFSLPFNNPLANFDFQSFRQKLFQTSRLSTFSSFSEDSQSLTAEELTLIPTNEEEVIFKNIQNQDRSRLRAVKQSLVPSLTNPLQPKLDPFPQIEGHVVIMGGYRGSILRDRQSQRRVWIPIKVGLNIRKIDLTVGPTDEDEIEMEKSIYPDGMLTHIGPVDISRKLLRKLQSQPKCVVHEFSYDWRLSSDLNSKKLLKFLRELPCNRPGYKGKQGVIMIAHSMGGLIAHHAMVQDPQLFRGILYAGVPSACPNILGPLRYGDAVLLSSKVLTAQVNFLMRSSFVFLPIDGKCFVDRKDRDKRYDIDFFDVNTWIKYKLSPCVDKTKRRVMTYENKKSIPEVDCDRPMRRATTFNEPSIDLIPFEQAVKYLDRTLKRTKKFLLELEFDSEKTEQYPPMASLYGYTVPTLRGARVDGPNGIMEGDYNDLIFGAGDGVVYHKSTMPSGKGFDLVAKIPSDRGHVSLLTDIEGVGKALTAILAKEQTRMHK
ncbi:hypothetical protein TRVA0_026S00166 [Trichomonascus vanleenenianus]|uniref:uncharacterized protein n=1 Tax=Trichomonascus vanleenenianus TaxID=2268995 RepID=UPI003EC9C61D